MEIFTIFFGSDKNCTQVTNQPSIGLYDVGESCFPDSCGFGSDFNDCCDSNENTDYCQDCICYEDLNCNGQLELIGNGFCNDEIFVKRYFPWRRDLLT